MSDPPTYRRQVLAHLGLVAGMCAELGLGNIIDHAPHHNPAMRDLPVGEAGKALGLNGLGGIKQTRSLVPRFFPNQPTHQLLALRVPPAPLNDAALGRARETLQAYGVTDLYRLIAATAATRLGRWPRSIPLASPSWHGAGRDHSDEEPEEHGVPLTQGQRRAHRPALTHVMVEVSVEPHAGRPGRLTPLRGHSRDAHECGQVSRGPSEPVPTTSGATSVGAARALSRAPNLATLAQTQMTGIPRVPATWPAAPGALAPAAPQAMTARAAGDRDHAMPSTSGGVAHRWGLIDSAPRQPQAPRPVDPQRRPQRAKDVTAWQH